LILGTSYANQLFPGLASHPALAAESILSIGTCQPVDAEKGDPLNVDPDEPCSGDGPWRQQQFIDALIARTPSIRYVILDGLLADADDDYSARLGRRAAQLAHSGAVVIVFEPHTRPREDVRGCFSRPFKAARACATPVEDVQRARAQFRPVMAAVKMALPAALLFPQNDALCDAASCRMVVNGLPLYRDEFAHLSEYGSGLVADRFVSWAREHVPAMVGPTTGR
jgi:hypothetical protein